MFLQLVTDPDCPHRPSQRLTFRNACSYGSSRSEWLRFHSADVVPEGHTDRCGEHHTSPFEELTQWVWGHGRSRPKAAVSISLQQCSGGTVSSRCSLVISIHLHGFGCCDADHTSVCPRPGSLAGGCTKPAPRGVLTFPPSMGRGGSLSHFNRICLPGGAKFQSSRRRPPAIIRTRIRTRPKRAEESGTFQFSR
jgi:hypothetical protein